MCKNEKFGLTKKKKIFRQINSLVISLVDAMRYFYGIFVKNVWD